ncbi:cyclic nucleotide-binding domain-containing protein [Maritimibacter sp. UBA3975]|uniref:cyclic nucleotide-binding domain-containing protein n=1 Tax=Maritimibacter sp. UBA3975 TaxID=1946833 RepID=UPI0025B7CDFF|nr:cyclic nucleotide-binding domain-containing protein [Maritimibacter sp. UBA3975]|tara:strand:+ start:9398 stop:10114 length:717 start_codon:yes stop_codon:yes gene_type:complete
MIAFGSITPLEWAGFLGVAVYLAGYLLLQLGLIRGSGYVFPAMNLVASILVLLGLSSAFNWPSAALQIAWAGISVFGIARIYFLNSRLSFSDEEQTLIAYGLPRMSKPTARNLLNRGVWFNAEPGTVLTTEGECVTHLHFMLHGTAEVSSGNKSIAEIKRGFVGEMNVMEAAPASATVSVSEPSRVFSVSGTTLRKLAETDADFASSLSVHLARSTKEKLIEANRKLSSSEDAKDHAG